MENVATSRRYELDYLRVFATFGVILLHTGAIVVIAWRHSNPELISAFNIGNAADSLGRFAVNCFFMASGALLLNPARNFSLKTQFWKVARPTITWIAIIAIANIILAANELRGLTGQLLNIANRPLTEVILGLLTGPAAYHLWFVYAILGIYLVVPLLRPIVELSEPRRQKLIVWLLTLWLVGDLSFRFGAFFWGSDFPKIYAEPFAYVPAGYLGLFVLGFALTHYREQLQVPRWLWALMAVVGLSWTFTATWFAELGDVQNVWYAYDNLNLPVLLYSIGVFGWFATKERSPGPAWQVVHKLSELSFRIYLAHALVLHLLNVATPLGPLAREQPPVGLPVLFLVTCAITVAISWTLSLIKPIQRWV